MVKILKVFDEKEKERMKELSKSVGCYHFNGGSITEDDGKIVAHFGVDKYISKGNLETLARKVREICLEAGFVVDEVYSEGLKVG